MKFSPLQFGQNNSALVATAIYANAFPKLVAAMPVPGLSSSGVALGASPSQNAGNPSKTRAAEAGSGVTGQTQQQDKSKAPAIG